MKCFTSRIKHHNPAKVEPVCLDRGLERMATALSRGTDTRSSAKEKILYLSCRKSIHDQDNAELRAVKEMFLPDGDLYSDGQGRTRHFRWRGIDENSQFNLFGDKGLWGDEEGEATELSTEEEIQRRKERYERETFLREELVG